MHKIEIIYSITICLAFSRQYLNNIGLVDSGVAEVVSIIEDFFNHDGRTAYVFTSDHGMTNWGRIILLQECISKDIFLSRMTLPNASPGSHGAGHPSETLTPLVVWGAGVQTAHRATDPQAYSDGYLQGV